MSSRYMQSFLSCYKLQQVRAERYFAGSMRLSSKTSIYFEVLLLPSIFTSLPGPTAEEHLTMESSACCLTNSSWALIRPIYFDHDWFILAINVQSVQGSKYVFIGTVYCLLSRTLQNEKDIKQTMNFPSELEWIGILGTRCRQRNKQAGPIISLARRNQDRNKP